MKKFILISLIFLILLSLQISKSDFVVAQNSLVIHFFWGEGCPHCAKEKLFLQEIKEKYPEIEIKSYEIYRNPENRKILEQFAENYKIQRLGVPLTFIKDKYFLGYHNDETTGKEIEGYIQSILNIGEQKEEIDEFKLPILGKVSLSEMSLPVLTLTLGALDGFNPCAMWILLFLIALLINTRSRKRMWLVGGTFIAASGIVYFLLLSAWLNLFLAVSYVNFTRIFIGVLALVFGTWQIRNFINFKPGVCKISNGKAGFQDRIKNSFRSRAEKIALSPFTLAMLVGVIILAVGVNLLEFFCSAGLPAIYTRILALNQLSTLGYYFYLLLYTFVFMLDDLIVFSLAIITLNKLGFTEKYNYWAALIGGLLIFLLGILLIFRPGFLMFN